MLETIKPNRPKVGSKWTIHCDGATLESNPSAIGGWGFAVWCDGRLFFAAHGQIVGHITNQTAEMIAVMKATMWCHQKGLQVCTIVSDSKVSVDVMNQDSTLKNPRLLRVEAAIRHSLYFIEPVFEHVTRDNPYQRFSDYLANLGNHGDRAYSSLEQHQALLDSYNRW
ncbi:ribonuclease HI [Plectonema phage JingP1]|nr:ribonuclease HI [Plectonema phage JingP1]